MPNLGGWEVFAILAVVVLLFGAKKLPELARGSGRALRIFKTEVTSLHDDDDDTKKPAPIEASGVEKTPTPIPASEPDKKPEQG